MKVSLKNQLLERLKNFQDWVPSHVIERKSQELGKMAGNGTRRVRELVEEGKVEQKEEKGIAWYRYRKQEKNIHIPELLSDNSVRLIQKTIYE